MNLRKGKIIQAVIFILVVTGLLALLLHYQSKQPVPGQQTQSVEDKNIVKKPKKGFAAEEYSQDQKDTFDNDAYNQALLTGEGCEKIKFNEKLKTLCLDTLAFNEARSKVDESLCEIISDKDMKTKCYDLIFLEIAVKSQNKTLCDQITDASTKQNCIDQILAFTGGSLKSAADCSPVSDITLRQNCINNFYYQKSINDLNINSCENIKDTSMKQKCYDMVSKGIEIEKSVELQTKTTYKTPEEKLKSCDELDENSSVSCKNESYFNMAGIKKDLSYCNKISDPELQASCIATQSVTINSYYIKQAVRTRDKNLCNKILDASLKNTCLTSF